MLRRLAIACLLLGLTVLARAAVTDEVRAADAARINATLAGNANLLAPLLSDQLTYGRANGETQNKTEYLADVRANRIHFLSYRYTALHVTPIGDDAAVLSGAAELRAASASGPVAVQLRFLAVWRREAGQWRLFAYQSAPLASSRR